MSAASGQVLAAILALAVAALVTLFVRYQKDEEQKNQAGDGAVTGAREDTKECVASYFPSGAFPTEAGLDFVCANADTRRVVENLEHRIQDDAQGKPSKISNAWSDLGWFQVALTASLRKNCCTGNGSNIELPASLGDCAGLAGTLQGTDHPTRGDELAKQTSEFERVATCLAQRGEANPYSYRSAPTTAGRNTFADFLERRARQQASADTK
jgi:hypothetical protein